MRNLGQPVELAARYFEEGADEVRALYCLCTCIVLLVLLMYCGEAHCTACTCIALPVPAPYCLSASHCAACAVPA